jgi:hypothetical protein
VRLPNSHDPINVANSGHLSQNQKHSFIFSDTKQLDWSAMMKVTSPVLACLASALNPAPWRLLSNWTGTTFSIYGCHAKFIHTNLACALSKYVHKGTGKYTDADYVSTAQPSMWLEMLITSREQTFICSLLRLLNRAS